MTRTEALIVLASVALVAFAAFLWVDFSRRLSQFRWPWERDLE